MHSEGAGNEDLGECPNCEVSLSPAQVLIEYDRSGSRSIYADCYRCGDVVHPV